MDNHYIWAPNPVYTPSSRIAEGIGIYYLVMPHINKETRYRDAIFYGGILGLVVYDFTTGSVLDQWDMKLAILDIIWDCLFVQWRHRVDPDV